MKLIAAGQMTSGADKKANLEVAEQLISEAAAARCDLVGLPENFSWMGPEAERQAAGESLEGPSLTKIAALAKANGISVLAGTIPETGAPGGRFFNTSVLFGKDGGRLAVYRKIHLFDVEVGDGAKYRESESVAPGSEVVVADSAVGKLGMSVCYDLRFPELYRRHSKAGATVISVPAAFTLMTGKDHWEVLLRARAIENQAYVFAPAQWGKHSESRQTYGHAMVVDPWGLVISRASEGTGLAVAPVSDELVARIRRNLPCLSHRRLD